MINSSLPLETHDPHRLTQLQTVQTRRFTDSGGTEWEVYLLVSTPQTVTLPPTLPNQFRPFKTWLAFDSETERRRLWPVPLGWKDATTEELTTFLRLATKVAVVIEDDET